MLDVLYKDLETRTFVYVIQGNLDIYVEVVKKGLNPFFSLYYISISPTPKKKLYFYTKYELKKFKI